MFILIDLKSAQAFYDFQRVSVIEVWLRRKEEKTKETIKSEKGGSAVEEHVQERKPKMIIKRTIIGMRGGLKSSQKTT